MKKENKVLNFFITTLNGMAYGLFATLIIGTILATFAKVFPNGETAPGISKFFNTIFSNVATCLQFLTGAGIGVGVAVATKQTPLKIVVLGAVGEIAGYLSLSTKFVTSGVINNGNWQIGDPLTIYIVVILVMLFMQYVLVKKTPVDILLIPLSCIILGTLLACGIRFPAIYVTFGVQWLVDVSTSAVPFVMGIVVAVLMGMALTAPISSAAIAAMIFTVPAGSSMSEGIALASGAAIVGCCCQMVGFAIQSRKDNSLGMVISIGIGTSMLQFKNILKKPIIWLPTIIASAILGPISTCLVKLQCAGSSAGMGTAGLIGQIGTITTMGSSAYSWLWMLGLEIVFPLILVFGIDLLFRKLNLIKDGDLKV